MKRFIVFSFLLLLFGKQLKSDTTGTAVKNPKEKTKQLFENLKHATTAGCEFSNIFYEEEMKPLRKVVYHANQNTVDTLKFIQPNTL